PAAASLPAFLGPFSMPFLGRPLWSEKQTAVSTAMPSDPTDAATIIPPRAGATGRLRPERQCVHRRAGQERRGLAGGPGGVSVCVVRRERMAALAGRHVGVTPRVAAPGTRHAARRAPA